MQTKEVTVKRGRKQKKKRWHFEWTSKAEAVSHLHLTAAFGTSQHGPVSPSHMCAKSNGEMLLNHFELSHMRSGPLCCSFKLPSKLARNHYTPLTPFLGSPFPGLMPGHVYIWFSLSQGSDQVDSTKSDVSCVFIKALEEVFKTTSLAFIVCTVPRCILEGLFVLFYFNNGYLNLFIKYIVKNKIILIFFINYNLNFQNYNFSQHLRKYVWNIVLY